MRVSAHLLLAGLTLALCVACSAAGSAVQSDENTTGVSPDAPGFRPVRIGGGGFVVDLDASIDGQTILARTDVHGAYVWNSEESSWKQLITPTSLPTGDPLIKGGTGIGVYAVNVAPSDSRRIYMVVPGLTKVPSTVYRSDDRGQHWLKTNFKPVEMTMQSDGRSFGPKLAISPADPNLVLLGDSAGHIYRTLDGGNNWAQVGLGAVPVGPEPAIAFVRGRVRDSAPQIFVATGSNGVFQSGDNGTSWRRVPGGPAAIRRMASAPGNLFATDRDDTSLQNAWKWDGTNWTRLNIAAPGKGNSWHSIAISPKSPLTVVLGSASGNIAMSTDGGKSWNNYYNNAPDRIAKDVPWLEHTQESWMSNGNMIFDPRDPTRLIFGEGIGVWVGTPPAGGGKPTWVSQTRGIDELIVNDLVMPDGGKLLVATQDRGVFRIENPERYPASHGPDMDAPIRHAWALDFAPRNPSFVAMIANGGSSDKSGFSTDGGKTWQTFASLVPGSAPGNIGGTVAVSTERNIVWAPSNNGRPFFTLDGGQSWQLAQFPPNLPTTDELGWAFMMYQNRHVFSADRVVPGTFYAYNYGPGSDATKAGFYRSTDGGKSWVRTAEGFGMFGYMGTSARLEAVPGQAGHLFFAAGTTGLTEKHPYDFSLQFSRDGGSSWRALPKTQEVWTVGFGKAAKGANYPTIFIAGYANRDREPAIYCSIDQGQSWQKLVSYPGGNIDTIRVISGDMTRSGRLYYGFSGSGAGYGVFSQCQ